MEYYSDNVQRNQTKIILNGYYYQHDLVMQQIVKFVVFAYMIFILYNIISNRCNLFGNAMIVI